MVLPWLNNSAKKDTVAFLKGTKKSPSDADYKPASSDSKKRCHECANYGKPGSHESDCKKVIGIVVAEGVCDFWQQRKYEEEAPKHDAKTEIVIRLSNGG